MAPPVSLPNGSNMPFEHDPTSQKTAHLDESDIEQHEVDYDGLVSPLHMPPGQIDGLEALQAERFSDHRAQSPSRRGSSNRSLLRLRIPGTPSPAQLALSAMQYLPYPLMIMDGLKTLILANEAMGKLLGISDEDGDASCDDGLSALDRLKGQTLSQLGIDLIQDGRPVWVTWESFLDNLAEEMGTRMEDEPPNVESENGAGDVTPTAKKADSLSRTLSANKNNSVVHDAVVEVILTPPQIPAAYFARTNNKQPSHVLAKMIITVWEIEDEKFFTLTFTSTDATQTSLPGSHGQSRRVTKPTKNHSLGSTGSGSASHSSPSSVCSGWSSSHGASTNATSVSMSSSPFPPLGPPSRNTASAPSSLQKVVIMKNALLDNTETPIYAMWKDESLAIPNKAARKLFHPSVDLTSVTDGLDLVSKWHTWDETFTTRLDPSEYPISVLIRTQTPFSSRKIGMYDPATGEKLILDCLGEDIRDENTGEFLAGMITCRDITRVTNEINEIKEKDEQRFHLICDSMPQLIWTTTPDGMCDWFSQRWEVSCHLSSLQD